MARILAFAGSTREGSYNRKLIRIAASGAREACAEVHLVELADYPMPIMNEDLEAGQGIPPKALEFKQLMLENDGLLISAPEYNSSITPLLKNVLDWASRSETSEEIPLSAFRGMTAVVMSASPGSLGGLRGLVVLRMMLGNLGVTVLPDTRSISSADKAFQADGSLASSKDQKAVTRLGRILAETLERLGRSNDREDR
ncbi:MAG: NAD(P)H-dependent oxidoreductase [Candidatus Fermentibacteraceae bacterium]|nr:NAD(P)H-dependent oxidoreductase [Candidatus Fermentibacteraceae bacterium]MBN2609465.1 NAD(P)H-dependent oxidoreductase [Candidatus Fermentibacteraceae bacterium]